MKSNLAPGIAKILALMIVVMSIVGFSKNKPETQVDLYQNFRFQSKGRVVAIGDLHGDLHVTRSLLKRVHAIDDKDQWIGGKLVLVQTGDELDRADEDFELFQFLESLSFKALEAGGRIILLNGNHELMNAALNFKYVTKNGFLPFVKFIHLERNDVSIRAGVLPKGIHALDYGVRERAHAFHAGGAFAQILAQRPLFAIVDDTVFVHGGISLAHLTYGLTKMDLEVKNWLEGKGELPIPVVSPKDNETSPVWIRRFSNNQVDEDTCLELRSVLKKMGVRTMVVGHTRQRFGIRQDCQGQLWKIDVGLSRGEGSLNFEALEIEKGRFGVIY